MSVEVKDVDVDAGVQELAHLLHVVVARGRKDLVLVHQMRHCQQVMAKERKTHTQTRSLAQQPNAPTDKKTRPTTNGNEKKEHQKKKMP